MSSQLPAAGTVTSRREDVSAWYIDVLREAHLVDSSPVRGCYVMMPRGMSVWERLRGDLDKRIAATGAVNGYFPLLVPLSFLSKEAEHVEGFAKECAVVTHTRLHMSPEGAMEPDPSAQLQEPYVIRPTSETVVWDSFRRWIRTAADLPVLVNQWANVLRWERRTRPFLRTSEFLWQEGHTAHATREEAVQRAVHMLAVYADSVRETLALPVIPGVKSPSERFAGAEETLTIEAMMQDGWALQCGTSHFLGTGFGEAFGVRYTGADGCSQPVWATSWGVSTRLLGATIMSHSDDIGFVCPPAVAPVQVEILPVGRKGAMTEVVAAAKALANLLRRHGIRAQVDLELRELAGPGGEDAAGGETGRARLSLGKRRFASERRGCPLRVELGAKELEAGVARLHPRIGLTAAAAIASVQDACGDGSAQSLSPPWQDAPENAADAGVATARTRWGLHEPTSVAMTGADPASIRCTSPPERELAATALTTLAASLHEGEPLVLRLPRRRGVEEDATEDIAAVAAVRAVLQTVHACLLTRAEARMQERTTVLYSRKDLEAVAATLDREGSGSAAASLEGTAFVLAPWHDDADAEAEVKAVTKLTIRCFPAAKQSEQILSHPCAWSGRPATHVALFARAY